MLYHTTDSATCACLDSAPYALPSDSGRADKTSREVFIEFVTYFFSIVGVFFICWLLAPCYFTLYILFLAPRFIKKDPEYWNEEEIKIKKRIAETDTYIESYFPGMPQGQLVMKVSESLKKRLNLHIKEQPPEFEDDRLQTSELKTPIDLEAVESANVQIEYETVPFKPPKQVESHLEIYSEGKMESVDSI